MSNPKPKRPPPTSSPAPLKKVKVDPQPTEPLDFEVSEKDKKNLIMINRMNKIYGKLLQKESDVEKTILIEKSLDKLINLLPKLIHKKTPSKFFQACFKFGNAKQQALIFNKLKEGDIGEVCKSKYGHFLLIKILKKADKNQRDAIFEEIKKNVYTLASQQEPAKVIDCLLKFASPHQLTQLKSAFSSTNFKKSTEKLENIAMRIIEKNLTSLLLSKHILNQAFDELIPAEKEKIIDCFKEKMIDLSRSKEGLALAYKIINFSNNKQKKAMVKGLKDKIGGMIKEGREYLLIMKIMHNIDDRELISKFIMKEIKGNLNDILKSQNGLNLISSFLIPNYNILATLDNTNTTCKKNEQVRKEEVISMFIEDLAEFFNENLSENLKQMSTSRIISFLITKILTNLDYFNKPKCYELISNVMNQFADANDLNNSLLIHIDANKILKNIIRIMEEIEPQAKDFITEKLDVIVNEIISNMLFILSTKGIYIVIALIENTNYKEMILEHLQKIKKKLPKEAQGMDIILKNL